MLLRIDPTSGSPLYRQIADQVRGAIVRGEIRPGERLPNARDLASSLGVNLQTVLRGYAQLRDEGLVDVRRRRGVTVIATAEQTNLRELARALVGEARRLGTSDVQIRRLVEEAL